MFGVYMSVRNEERLIQRAVLSAADAGASEILVMDDASTDGTLEELDFLASALPGRLRIVRHATKTDCHQRALFDEVKKMQSEWVLGMGADDFLVRRAIRWAFGEIVTEAPVIFFDYSMVNEDAVAVTEPSRCGYNATTHLTAAGVRDRLKHSAKHECGVGAFVRRGHILKLYGEMEAWRMGPWSDSIGLTTLACLHGATYVPAIGALFTVSRHDGRRSYHQRALADPAAVAGFRREAVDFVGRHLEVDAAATLLAKWFG